MSARTPTKVRTGITTATKKPLSLRYAEVVKLRQAIQRALAESKSSHVGRHAPK